jgi:hypothetical protein
VATLSDPMTLAPMERGRVLTVPEGSMMLAPRTPLEPGRVLELAKLLYDGGMCNKHITKPAQLAARIIAGHEVGLKPVQSVNWIAIMGGRAVIWGDAALALVRTSGMLDGDITETYEGEGDERRAVCVSKRKGAAEPRTTTFSVADAKKAGLWGKQGPWTDYPERQLMWRARGWNLRDNFNEVLCGLGIAEEEMDVPQPVRQLNVPAPLPPTAAEQVEDATAQAAEPKADEATIKEIAVARPGWLRAKGIDAADPAAVAEAWGELLGTYGVTSAKHLPASKARELLKSLREQSHQQEVKEVFNAA